MKRACIVGLLGALVALTLACGSGEKEAATQPSATTPTPAAPTSPPAEGQAQQGAAQRRANVPAQITQGELPDDFPSDLPVFPDAQPRNSMMVGGSGLLLLGTSASVADVLSHYREQLPSQGWTVDAVTEGAGGTKASVRAHKESRNATISISQAKDGAGTEIGIALKSGT
jgi:hypothetical protein